MFDNTSDCVFLGPASFSVEIETYEGPNLRSAVYVGDSFNVVC